MVQQRGKTVTVGSWWGRYSLAVVALVALLAALPKIPCPRRLAKSCASGTIWGSRSAVGVLLWPPRSQNHRGFRGFRPLFANVLGVR